MTCATCGQELVEGALFCENCGAKVGADAAPTALDVPAGATDDDSPISRPTSVNHQQVVADAPQTRVCADCGGTVGAEGYCDQCGAKAATERDHFREAPAAWVAGVCDRGVQHHRNEDAMALWADASGRAVLVVCDGVSSSTDSDVASLAAARAARDVLRAPMPKGLGVPESVEAAAAKVFAQAAAAANTAVIANTAPSSPNPASCTFVAVTLEGELLRHACIGDSRAYWFPDAGEGVQLTTDDSMAQMLIAGGTSREEAERAPQAHAITKWLGKDSPDIVPVTGSRVLEGAGWVLVCSDGLWNYASDPAALRTQLDAALTSVGESGQAAPAEGGAAAVPAEGSAAPAPADVALALVEFAKQAGGHDNITVALARVGAAG